MRKNNFFARLVSAFRPWVWLVLAAELVFLLVQFSGDLKTGTPLTVTGSDFSSYSDACVLDDTGVTVKDFEGQFATTKWLSLTRGSYRVAVSYTNDGSEGTVTFVDDAMPGAAYDVAVLPFSRTGTVFSLWMNYGSDRVQPRLNAGGQGTLHINSLQFIPTHAYAYTRFIVTALLLALLTWLVLVGTHQLPLPLKTVAARHTALVLGGIVLLACLPLLSDYLPLGHDMPVHLSRIEGVVAGLQAGQFPVRMYPNLPQGMGYPFGVLYADVLLYPAALLRIIGFPLQTAYQFTLVLVTAATALICWYCLRQMLSSDKIALVGCALYTLSPYRLVDQYTRAALGELAAMAFLPLIIYGFWRIYFVPKGRRDWLALALGFTGLVLTHLLTLEMAGLLAIVFCLICWRKTFTKSTLLNLSKAAGLTVLWGAWFLVPMLGYLAAHTCQLASTEIPLALYQSGARIPQLLGIFGNAAGGNTPLAAGMSGDCNYSPGFGLLAGAALMLLCAAEPALTQGDARRKGVQRAGLLSLIMAVLCLWLSSTLFPWYPITQGGGFVADIFNKLQFVWRFVSPACALLLCATCCALWLLNRNHKSFVQAAAVLLLALSILPSGALMLQYSNQPDTTTYLSLASLDTPFLQISNAEYLPATFDGTADVCAFHTTAVFDDALTVTDYTKSNLTINLTATAPAEAEAGATLPLLYYPGYTVTSADGTPLSLTDAGGLVHLTLPAGYNSTATVRFVGLWYWHLSDLLSLLAIAASILWFTPLQRFLPVANPAKSRPCKK